MKTFHVTLTKPGAKLTAEVRYRDTEWPAKIIFKGDLHAFVMADGRPISLRCSYCWFEETLYHQASICGADKVEFYATGDEPIQYIDNVVPEKM